MAKHILKQMIFLTVYLAFTNACFSQETGVYLRAGLGAGKPLMETLSEELEKQGREMPEFGYVLPVSIGKKFLNEEVGAELIFSYSIIPGLRYKNDYEDFKESFGHYSFSFLIRKYLLPGKRQFSPSVGAGIGYGRSNLVSGGGRLESAELILSALIESEFRKNKQFFIEAVYTRALNTGTFEAAHIENVSGDIILDSLGNPLEENYSFFEIRAGISFYLKTPKSYY